MAKTILIASGKGGTGKTSTSAHIATEFANQNYKVLLIDTDCGFKGLDLVLGLSDKIVFNFADVLENRVSVMQAVAFDHDFPNLHLLSAPLISSQDYALGSVAKMINQVFDYYDYILVDCAAGYTYETEMFAKVSNLALIVSTPDSTSIRGAENIARKLEIIGLTNCYLVINRLRTGLVLQGKAANIDDVIDFTGLPLIGIIPEDENVISCGNDGVPVYTVSKSESSIAYKNISNRLLGHNINLMNLK